MREDEIRGVGVLEPFGDQIVRQTSERLTLWKSVSHAWDGLLTSVGMSGTNI